MRRIVEQVRVETEQWSQMQEMLGQVRDEMEELQASCDFWEDRALDSDYQIQSLLTAVSFWLPFLTFLLCSTFYISDNISATSFIRYKNGNRRLSLLKPRQMSYKHK